MQKRRFDILCLVLLLATTVPALASSAPIADAAITPFVFDVETESGDSVHDYDASSVALGAWCAPRSARVVPDPTHRSGSTRSSMASDPRAPPSLLRL